MCTLLHSHAAHATLNKDSISRNYFLLHGPKPEAKLIRKSLCFKINVFFLLVRAHLFNRHWSV